MAPPSDESSAGSSVKIVTIGDVRVESSRVWTHPNKCCPAAAATNGSNQNPVALLAKQLRKAAGNYLFRLKMNMALPKERNKSVKALWIGWMSE